MAPAAISGGSWALTGNGGFAGQGSLSQGKTSRAETQTPLYRSVHTHVQSQAGWRHELPLPVY